ncbi:MAG: hypothetical protein LW601_07005 [Cryomorphaceae bacterium]|jgi:hypothetical protein|nr:hypothetical protein [Cryomorphaceae bacterium]
MKNTLLFALMAGTLLFMWQFISFAGANLHEADQRYHPMQDRILADLAAYNLDDAGYMLGQPAPNATNEEREAYMGTRAGQPWAHVVWHPAQDTDMLKPLLRGFTSNMFIAGLLYWLLGQLRTVNPWRGALFTLVVAYVGYTYFVYSDHVWYDTPDHVVHLIDTVVPWSVVGALGGLMHARSRA